MTRLAEVIHSRNFFLNISKENYGNAWKNVNSFLFGLYPSLNILRERNCSWYNAKHL